MKQLQELELKKEELGLPLDVQISSKVPAINKSWVMEELLDFADKYDVYLNDGNCRVHFVQRPWKGQIVQCKASFDTKISRINVKGEGIDEYEALKDCLRKAEFKLVKEKEISLNYFAFEGFRGSFPSVS